MVGDVLYAPVYIIVGEDYGLFIAFETHDFFDQLAASRCMVIVATFHKLTFTLQSYKISAINLL